MAADPGSIPDPLAGAKANLRDTVKWLATTLAALAAVVLAGTSLTGLERVSGVDLKWALLGGAVAIIAVLLVISLLLGLLISEAFYFGDLFLPENASVLEELERRSTELLPPTIPTMQRLREVRRETLELIRASEGTPDYDKYVRYLEQLRQILASVTYFAQFERMRQRLRRDAIPLFVLTLVGVAGLVLFVVAMGKGNPAPEARPAVTNVVYPPVGGVVPSLLPGEAARDDAIRVLLVEAVRRNQAAGTSPGQSSTISLQPLVDLIHGLHEAGLMSADEADSLTKDLQSNAIGGGREILVHLANRGIDRLFPPESTPAAALPISINVSGCCASCQVRSSRSKRSKSAGPRKPKSAGPTKPKPANPGCPLPARSEHAATH